MRKRLQDLDLSDELVEPSFFVGRPVVMVIVNNLARYLMDTSKVC